jgi:hypothetical protein
MIQSNSSFTYVLARNNSDDDGDGYADNLV